MSRWLLPSVARSDGVTCQNAMIPLFKKKSVNHAIRNARERNLMKNGGLLGR